LETAAQILHLSNRADPKQCYSTNLTDGSLTGGSLTFMHAISPVGSLGALHT